MNITHPIYRTGELILSLAIITALVLAGTAAFLLSGKLIHAVVKLFV